MTFTEVVGHREAAARLARAATEGRVPPAVLLVGPEGIGKRTLADAFVARLLCTAPAGRDACGACAQCTRVAAGTHPDLHRVTPEDGHRDIRIEQVRELTRWLALQPLMAECKVGLIDEAHRLSEQAQNALLKTLEEPPGASVLVLVASSAALLLPTARSRCQVVRLDPLAAEDVEQVLERRGVPAERARVLASLAEGSPGRAAALDGEEAGKARTIVLDTLPALGELSADRLSRSAQDIAKGAAAEVAVEAALTTAVAWYRDVLATTLAPGASPLRLPALADRITHAAARLPAPVRLRQLEAVYDTIVALEKNANRMLAIETMLLSLRALERATSSSSWNLAR